MGALKVIAAVSMLGLLSTSRVPLAEFSQADMVAQVIVGAASAYLGYKLLRRGTRRPVYFTVLITIYTLSLTLHGLHLLSASPTGPSPTGLVPILSVWALWAFIKGRERLIVLAHAEPSTAGPSPG